VTETPKVESLPSTSNQTGDAIDSSPVIASPDVDFEKGKYLTVCWVCGEAYIAQGAFFMMKIHKYFFKSIRTKADHMLQ
jgi:hypothetical protein